MMQEMGRKDFDDKGATEILMVRMSKPLCDTVKVVVMYILFFVIEGLI